MLKTFDVQNALQAIASRALSTSKGNSYHHSRLWSMLKLWSTGSFDGEWVLITLTNSTAIFQCVPCIATKINGPP